MQRKTHEIQIYDRTAGCACRPGEQRGMMMLRSILHGIRKEFGESIAISYFTYDRDKTQFSKDKQINSLISEGGLGVLPVTIVDGKIRKSKAIPSLAEFREYLA